MSILVTNNDGPIQVEAYINDPSNKNTIQVDAGVSKRVNTNPINVQSGSIIKFGFKALENGTQIDSFETTVVATDQAQASQTPPPENAILNGKVVDSATNAPISGAKVTLTSTTWSGKNYTVTTDSTGSFTTPGMYADSFVISITANGYRDYVSQISAIKQGVQTMNAPLLLTKLPPGAMSTTNNTTSADQNMTSPTATSSDSWASLVNSPTACLATAGGGIGLVVSLTALYEWIQRQRDRRKK